MVEFPTVMTEMNYTPPEFEASAFNCPHCGAFAQQEWKGVSSGEMIVVWNIIRALMKQSVKKREASVLSRQHSVHFANCLSCSAESLWLDGKMLFPDFGGYPPPNNDMPDNVKGIYREAAAIANKSPRAAAALLRLVLQELCKTLGCKGDNLRKQIERLAESGKVSSDVIKAADIVRLVGNDAVHPDRVGVDIENAPDVAKALFEFINWVAKEAISDPKARREKIAKLSAPFPNSKKIKPQNGEKP